MEYLAILLVCTFSGVLTGLLGIGGGLIIVPFFMSVLPLFGIHTFSLHQIIGISSTCVFINSAATIFYRRNEKFMQMDVLWKLSFAIIFGTVSGAYLTSFAPSKLIFGIYVAVCLVSLYLMNRDVFFNIQNSRLRFLLYPLFAAIGAISSSIGIGGAILFATALKCFIDSDTKALLPSITFLVTVHAFFAFSSKLVLGEVVLFIIPIAIVASLVGSKIGIFLSKKASSGLINKMMSAVLIFGLLRIGAEFFR
ncbi:MAG: sulfite exporter TauE/SafE family protein [Candidatus Gastranaerophilales bacterium]|nr:sulfite exporter TauE/SafE family protein [Candidatus Gastranaerophilales bacterium]